MELNPETRGTVTLAWKGVMAESGTPVSLSRVEGEVRIEQERKGEGSFASPNREIDLTLPYDAAMTARYRPC